MVRLRSPDRSMDGRAMGGDMNWKQRRIKMKKVVMLTTKT